MSRLASRAEAHKLARLLGRAPEELAFGAALPAESLRELRDALSERLFDFQLRAFRRLARLTRWLPLGLIVWLARRWLGPLLTARVASEMPAHRAAAVAVALPAAFLAEVAAEIDPRRTRDILQRLPIASLRGAARALLARGDVVTLGRFVGYLSDEAVRAVVDDIEDEGVLLDIAYFVESRNRLDHIVHVLPQARVQKAILLVQDPQQRARWPRILALLSQVGYALQQSLGDLAAAQGEAVLDDLVRAIQQEDTWADTLPVVANLSQDLQQRVVNLAVLREPGVLARILEVADAAGLWSAVLPLIGLMDAPMRAAVAGAAAALSPASMRHIAYAALLGEHWETLFDVVARLPAARQQECLAIARGYGAADAELYARLARSAHAHGIAVPDADLAPLAIGADDVFA